MNWYYAKNGNQNGPIPTEDMKDRIAMGEIAPTDLAWCEGMADWTPVGEIPQLKVDVPTQAEAPSMPPPPVAAADSMPSPAPAPSPYQAPAAPSSGPIPNYLWQSIVVTILCCWPLGIPAIVYAAKVEGLKARGDIAAAKAASDNAKKWCIIALVSGLVIIAIYIALIATGVLQEAALQGRPPQALPTEP